MNAAMYGQQQPYLPLNYSQNILGSNNNPLNMFTPRLNGQGTMQQSNVPDLSQMGLGALPSSSPHLSSQSSIINPSENRQHFNQLGVSALDNQYSSLSNMGSQNHDNMNEQTLAKLLLDSSPHDKQIIMEKLQTERNDDRFI